MQHQPLFIQALEPRIMLDGAGAATLYSVMDDVGETPGSDDTVPLNNKTIQYDSDTTLPFADVKITTAKEIVFIDAQVSDYQSIINTLDSSVTTHIIQAHENGWVQMAEILAGEKNIDAVHVIGHGNAGQIVLGDSLLNTSTINQYAATLSSIGDSLSANADLLFYGCNIASTLSGEVLIKDIAALTKADVAASTDVTGHESKGGDWDLEHQAGSIETSSLSLPNYQDILLTISGNKLYMEAGTSFTVSAGDSATLSGSYDSHGEHDGPLLADDSGAANLVVSKFELTHVNGYGMNSNNNDPGDTYTSNGLAITINADGSYTADASDVTVAKTFSITYWASDDDNTNVRSGWGGGLIIDTILVAPVGVNDTDAVNEDATVTVDDGDDEDVLEDDTDRNSLTVTSIRTGDTEGSGTGDTIAPVFVDSFGVGSQETVPTDLAFNADGTKMFIVGATGDDVNEYTLTTGFDASTASFVDSFSVSSQEVDPTGLAFNADGTKMFVVGRTDARDVNEYTLTTGFDVSTASFVDGFSVSSQESSPQGLAFNTDGTKMFVTGDNGDDVNEYTLSTGFDVSTASFVDSFSVSSQETFPSGLAFNADGTKMFIIGKTGDDVNEYTLTTGFDVSTASFTGEVFDISSKESTPMGLAFSADGTKMFVMGYGSDKVHEYTLATGFDLNKITLTGTYGQLTMNVNGSYSYVANQSAADDLDAGDTVTDAFNYTVSDFASSDIATLTFTVTGVNDAPVGVNDTDAVNEDATVTVDDGDDEDVLGDDTDADDSASLTVSAIRTGDTEGSGTGGTIGSALTGTYGQLTMNANGSYSYVANQSATDDLDAGDTVTDAFNYTLSDGTATDTATLTFTVTGVNDAPVAANDTGAVNEDATLSVADGSGDIIADNDTDADDSATLTVSAIRTGSTEGSGSSGTVGSALTGTYGQLTLNANGSYTYVANQSAADDLDAGDTATDAFNYTLSDGTATDVGTLTVTVTGVNDAPVGVNDTDTVDEDATVTVSDGDDEDVLGDDTDADDSASLSVSSFRTGSTEGSGTEGTLGSALTGTYGQLTLNANGSYTYVANQSAADDLGAGETATDSFNYTVSDGTTTDTATLTFTITGVNNDAQFIIKTDTLTTPQITGGPNPQINPVTAEDPTPMTGTTPQITGGPNPQLPPTVIFEDPTETTPTPDPETTGNPHTDPITTTLTTPQITGGPNPQINPVTAEDPTPMTGTTPQITGGPNPQINPVTAEDPTPMTGTTPQITGGPNPQQPIEVETDPIDDPEPSATPAPLNSTETQKEKKKNFILPDSKIMQMLLSEIQLRPDNLRAIQESSVENQETDTNQQTQKQFVPFKSLESVENTSSNFDKTFVPFKSIDSLDSDTTQPSEEFSPFQSIESLSGTEDNLEAHNFIPLSQQVEQEMDEWNHYGEKVLAHLG